MTKYQCDKNPDHTIESNKPEWNCPYCDGELLRAPTGKPFAKKTPTGKIRFAL